MGIVKSTHSSKSKKSLKKLNQGRYYKTSVHEITITIIERTKSSKENKFSVLIISHNIRKKFNRNPKFKFFSINFGN